MMGTVQKISPDDERVYTIIERTQPTSDTRKSREEYVSSLHCLDDEVERGAAGYGDSHDQLEGKVLQIGDYFGGLVFENQQPKRVANYYIAESGCQILMLSQRVITHLIFHVALTYFKALEQMKEKSPKLYEEVRYRFKERLSHSDTREATENPGKIAIQLLKGLNSDIQTSRRNDKAEREQVSSNELESVSATVQQIEISMQSLKKQLAQLGLK